MYAAVRNYYGAEARFAAELAKREDDIRNLLEGIPGFHGYYLISTARSVIALSLYDDHAGAEESNRRAADWIPSNFPGLAVSAPAVSSGEVIIQF